VTWQGNDALAVLLGDSALLVNPMTGSGVSTGLLQVHYFMQLILKPALERKKAASAKRAATQKLVSLIELITEDQWEAYIEKW